MIPSNIQRNHILKAIREIDRQGVPPRRRSRDFLLEVNGRHYPPKYAVSLANQFANGEELNPSLFSGGRETNDFLRSRGFENIIEVSSQRRISVPKPSGGKVRKRKRRQHNERCPECKNTIEKMLRHICGDVSSNYKFEVGAKVEDYKDYTFYQALKRILLALQEYRGHKNFVRTSNLPRCDFFIPNPGFILEFDESQHFTKPREITLKGYPDDLKLGFDRDKWIQHCISFDKKDNDPPYRDEQRAWYDTLRDFLPKMVGLGPTVRLFARDFRWCSLKPDDDYDVEKFKMLLRGRGSDQQIEVIVDPNPSLARIVISGEWAGNVETAKELLKAVCKNWPAGDKVDFLVTCGAFLTFDWPKILPNIRDNRYPSPDSIKILIDKARSQCEALLDEDLIRKLSTYTRYVTIGIDSYKEKISLSNVSIRHPHAVFARSDQVNRLK